MNRSIVCGLSRFLYATMLFGFISGVYAADQTWNVSGGDDVWSTNKANWDVSSVWTNGNNAVFSSGSGETIDLSNVVEVADITFLTNGYEIADVDTNGTFSLSGSPSIITVVNTNDSAAINEIIAGNGGFTKTGPGMLAVKRDNTYTGVTTVGAGTLILEPSMLNALGATGTGNNTVVEDGATIDFNGCYSGSSTAEKFTISGDGVDGLGCLVNNGPHHLNKFLKEVIIAEDASVGGPGRIDFTLLSSDQKTITKIGAHQLAVSKVVDTAIIVNDGQYTLLANSLALGGDTWGDTTVNGGTLNSWDTLKIGERLFLDSGRFQQGRETSELTLTGHITFGGNILHTSGSNRGVTLSGYLDGTGGFSQAGDGWLYITGETNTYSGATIINSGKSLWVGGLTPGSDGILGVSAVTNNGYLYANSPLLTGGSVVNSGTVYANYGVLASGAIQNFGTLFPQGGVFGTGTLHNTGDIYFDYDGTSTISNSFTGGGTTYVRFGSDAVYSTGISTGSYFRMIEGSFTLTNGASYNCTTRFNVTDRQNAYYGTNALGPFTSIVNVMDGSTLNMHSSEFGNGYSTSNWVMTAIFNQYGGSVRTYGTTSESNGVRIAHWPQAQGTYNMMGGTLVIDNGWDLGIATDGTGHFHQTGGEVYASRVMLNERTGANGFGTLTLEGGVLNIGLTNGILNIEQNGIMADSGATYLVEYGGAGGIVRAITNFVAPAHATLYGSGTNAITFDTQEWEIDQSGDLTGDGGFNKSGSGSLILSGDNTYTGVTQVLEGQLVISSATALPDGGEVLFRVSSEDTGGQLYSDGDLDLSGIVVGVANPDDLDKTKIYTIATYDGSLTGMVESNILPYPWYLTYDSGNKRVKLLTPHGTLIIVR
ncbi:MAG: autotransporter-associated beta strand repeat-containing protein [Kiritimatiellae bacterium]|jgi:fibronectin-binding autotransporter adhesin|nr:autotransporter-associated beta strand repeat-containing protein [Kiritimatiellia bacterium]